MPTLPVESTKQDADEVVQCVDFKHRPHPVFSASQPSRIVLPPVRRRAVTSAPQPPQCVAPEPLPLAPLVAAQEPRRRGQPWKRPAPDSQTPASHDFSWQPFIAIRRCDDQFGGPEERTTLAANAGGRHENQPAPPEVGHRMMSGRQSCPPNCLGLGPRGQGGMWRKD